MSAHRNTLREPTTFEITLLISLVIHIVIIALVKFAPPDLKKFRDALPTLEVMLVNTKTKTAPEKADVLAQANLDRGGNTDADRKLKSPLPTQKRKKQELHNKPNAEQTSTSKSAALDAQVIKEQKRVAELEKQTQELMTQIQSDKKIDAPPKQTSVENPETGQQKTISKSLNTEQLIASSLEIDRLEALIAKQQDELQKRPRKKFIGARAKEDRFAYYVEAWRQKVEKIGNLNYPEAAKEQKLYGRLQLTVSINADGHLEDIKIERSSGHKVLDEAAKKIVELSAPFAPFPDDIRKDTDILSITRTWTFTREDNLSTEF